MFVICAYRESPYLKECIESLKNQVIPSDIILCTSTPNQYICDMASKYEISLMVNEKKGDIQIDWNYAYGIADAEYVTLVHQDDVYHKEYTKHLYQAIDEYEDIIIFFTKYRPLKMKADQKSTKKDINCHVRNLFCSPMLFSNLQNKKQWKKGILRLGNTICCSSVTYHKSRLKNFSLFDSELRYSLDWDTFLKLSELEGRFVCAKRELTYFRIHDQATSKKCIENKMREKEDYIMFCKLWPKPIAKVLMLFYRLAYLNYK